MNRLETDNRTNDGLREMTRTPLLVKFSPSSNSLFDNFVAQPFRHWKVLQNDRSHHKGSISLNSADFGKLFGIE